jgi:prefoldin subunit 1
MPRGKLNAKLEGQVKQKEGEVDQLGKKLHYLETTFKNSREHIDKMLKSQGA